MESELFKGSNFADQMETQLILNEHQSLGLNHRLNRLIHDKAAPILASII